MGNFHSNRGRVRVWLKGWNGCGLAVALITFLSAVAQRVWIATNQAPPELLDDSDHLWASIQLYQALTQHGVVEFVRQFINTTSHHFHPPLIPALTAPFYLLFGPSFAAALWFNTATMVLFYVYLFKLARRMVGEMQAAVAVAITALFPMTYGLARVYLLEFGVAALVVIWLYYFYRSDAFSKKRYLPWLGLLLGGGLLAKATFPMYIVGPVLWEIFHKARSSTEVNLKVILGRTSLVGIIGGLLVLPWYWNNMAAVLVGAHDISGDLNETEVIKKALSWPQFSEFLTQFLRDGISVYFLILGLVLLGVLAVRRKSLNGRGIGFLLAWWLPSFLACALAKDKIARYVFPAFPAIAVLLSQMIVPLWPVSPIRRTLMLGGILLIPLGNFLQLSFFDIWTKLPQAVLKLDPLGILDTSKGYYLTCRVRSEEWPLQQILETIQSHTTKRPGQEIHGIMRFWLGPLTRTNLMFLGAARNIPLMLDEAQYDNRPIVDWLAETVTEGTDYEFLVIERPVILWSEVDDMPTIDYPPAADLPATSILSWFKLEDIINTGAGHYKRIATVSMPEGANSPIAATSTAEVVIYKRSSVPLTEQPAEEK